MDYNPVTEDPKNFNGENSPAMCPVILKSENAKLLGTVFIASGAGKKPTVILLHGFPGNENNFDIAHSICRFGWNVIVFHYRGTWGSEGIFSWQNGINDVKNVIESVRNNWLSEELKIDKDKLVLVGHSMGGFFSAWSLAKGLVNDVFVMGMFNLGFIGEVVSDNEMFQSMALETLVRDADFVKTESPENLLNEMMKHGSKWNLLSYGEVLAEKNFYMIAGSKDQTSQVDMHYLPLLNILNNINDKKEYGRILESGHSFSNKRIELTTEIIKWLEKISF